jgi:hypothetical protein
VFSPAAAWARLGLARGRVRRHLAVAAEPRAEQSLISRKAGPFSRPSPGRGWHRLLCNQGRAATRGPSPGSSRPVSAPWAFPEPILFITTYKTLEDSGPAMLSLTSQLRTQVGAALRKAPRWTSRRCATPVASNRGYPLPTDPSGIGVGRADWFRPLSPPNRAAALRSVGLRRTD